MNRLSKMGKAVLLYWKLIQSVNKKIINNETRILCHKNHLRPCQIKTEKQKTNEQYGK